MLLFKSCCCDEIESYYIRIYELDRIRHPVFLLFYYLIYPIVVKLPGKGLRGTLLSQSVGKMINSSRK